ncbi:DNA-binding death effector domain-containing protein [Echinococcus granulosus]|uniref:DNA-binding death effector domain-containing protein n=1 Tax=Echinococcus granulosus TaxID=6210 RepID=W6UJY1_ECHGR|nr:DNA-binding death effector domain-containing protein [Echinococcus granulosus]EUB61373.1 DNA-binding death effector domain-containing protein [Echinococcus granulosus]
MDGSGRYSRSWKCQISVGELYRWILAKLSDKDIKRALHKYRDLMPRQSDWNRKLTQATNIPELGFRYLYRCGQIDETNHRTMQKMLKYIDRQDVLPYFDTILYNTNNANCSIEELQKSLLDRVDVFLKSSTALTEDEVHPDLPYDIHQCQPLVDRRLTRSLSKRKSSEGPLQCVTMAKRPRRSSISLLSSSSGEIPGTSSSSSSLDKSLMHDLVKSCCGQVHSAIMAYTLAGPSMQTILNASLVSMLAVLHFTLSQSFGSANQPNTLSIASTSPYAIPVLTTNTNQLLAPNATAVLHAPGALSHSRLLAAMPHLVSMVRLHMSSFAYPLRIPQSLRPAAEPPAPQLPLHHPTLTVSQSGDLFQRRILLTGGVGITASANDSCIHCYCRIRLRIKIDIGASRDALSLIHVDRPDPFTRQVDMFLQASNLLRSRCPNEYICSLRFNRLHHLEAFWHDYTTGVLRRIIMANLLHPETHSLVGLGSWALSDDSPIPSSTTDATERSNRRGDAGSSSSRQSRRVRVSRSRSSSSRASEAEMGDSAVPASVPSALAMSQHAPLESLRRALLSVRRHLFHLSIVEPQSAVPLQQPGQQHQDPPPPPAHPQHQQPVLPAGDFDLFLFVSRREYENSRLLLMRNERTIPSLCRLVAASQFMPSPSATATAAAAPVSSPSDRSPQGHPSSP